MALRNPWLAETILLRLQDSCMARPVLILCLPLFFSLSIFGMSLADELAPPAEAGDTVPALTTLQVNDAIEQLRSPEFSVRQKSIETLQAANAEQIDLLVQAIQTSKENEVARRCVDLLERRYVTGDRDSAVVRQVSDALEAAAKSDRWFVAEAAQDSLERHWKRRVEITLLELQKMGAGMSPKVPEKLWENNREYSGPFRRPSPAGDDHLKIFVDEHWKADAKGFELLRRLLPLVSHDFMTGASRVSVVLIDGHTQQPEEEAELRAIFGDTRVSSRGAVCLGIIYQAQDSGGSGVEVSDAQDDSSAFRAGIRAGDVLLKFDGRTLKDFDELIEKLKAFRPGDEVTFQIRRDGKRTPFDVKVKLQGWYER